MTDAVTLAIEVVAKERELQQQREQLRQLNARIAALNSRHRRAVAELASAQRDRDRLAETNRALCGNTGECEQLVLIGEQALVIEQLRSENAELRRQLEEAQSRHRPRNLPRDMHTD